MEANVIVDYIRRVIIAQGFLIFLVIGGIIVNSFRQGFDRLKTQNAPLVDLFGYFSYLFSIVFISYTVFEKIGQPMSIKTPLAILIFLCGDIWAILLMIHVKKDHI